MSFSSFKVCEEYLLILILFSASTCGRVVLDFGIFNMSIELLVYCGIGNPGINWVSLQVAARLFIQSFPLILANYFSGKDRAFYIYI